MVEDANSSLKAVETKRTAREIKWEEDMKRLYHSQDLLFLNKYDEAEEVMRQGMEAKKPSKGSDVRDVRSVFGMLYALLSASKGIANLSDDQLSQCHDRLVVAERLAVQGEDWVGKHGIRGLCLISMGLVELLQHSYVKGIYNIMRSWKYIRILRDDGLTYEGMEKEVVRSAGSFYILYSFLPPTASKMAAWFSGFEGDREKGLKYMYDCWKEGGICAPWGALNYVSFHVDTKTFVGERMSRKEHANVVQMLNTYSAKYPGSVLFSISESGLYACDRNIPKARELNESAASELEKLPVLKWVLTYKRGIFYWTDCDWFNAGGAFEESMNIYIQAKRRSMVPFMAAYAFLSYLESMKTQPEHTEVAKAKCKLLVDIANSYSAMNKKNWGRQDVYGFKVFKRCASALKFGKAHDKRKSSKLPGMSLLKLRGHKGTSDEEATQLPWILLYLLECMVLQVRCTWFMLPEALENLMRKVKEEMNDRAKNGCLSKGDEVRVLMCFVEMYTQMDKVSDALATADRALKMESELSKKEKSFGAIPMILYYKAKIHQERGNLHEAKSILKTLKKYGSKYELAGLIYLKLIVLSQQLGFDFEQDYVKLFASAGYKKTVTVKIPQEENKSDETNDEDDDDDDAPSIIEWAWYVEKHTVGFRAEFHPLDKSKPPTIIQTIAKADTEGKFLIGEFRPGDETEGYLHLIWDNSFSRLRGKTVQYKVSPAYLKSEVQ